MYKKIIFITIFFLKLNTIFASSDMNKLDPKNWVGKAPDYDIHGVTLDTNKIFLKNGSNLI